MTRDRLRIVLASAGAAAAIVVAALLLLVVFPSGPPEPIRGRDAAGPARSAAVGRGTGAKAPSEAAVEGAAKAEAPEKAEEAEGPERVPLLEGRVIGPAGPVAGARVSLYPAGIALSLFRRIERIQIAGTIPDLREIIAHVRGVFEEAVRSGVSAETDEEGRYAFFDLRSGPYYLVVLARGHIPRFGDVIAIERGVSVRRDVILEAGARIAGRVVGPDGGPLAGVAVAAVPRVEGLAGFSRIIRRVLGYLSGAFLLGPLEDRSGEDGAFVLDSLPPGTYTLWARAEGRTPVDVPDIPTGSEGIVIQMRDGAAIAGRVVAEGGRPIYGAAIRLEGAEEGLQIPIPGASDVLQALAGILEPPTVGATSAPDGTFRIEHVPPGRYRLAIECEGHLPHRAAMELDWGEVRDLGDIALDAGASIAGIVRGEDGSTPAGAVVQARTAASGFLQIARTIADAIEGRHRVACDARGGFRVTGLAPGTYELVATAPGYGVGRTRARAPAAADVEIGLPAGLTLRGIVLDATTGEGLAGAVVRAEGIVAETEAAGRFALEGVVPGGEGALFRPRPAREPADEIRLTASREGYGRVQERIPAGQASEPLRIELAPAPAIRGIVLDPDGAPLPLALVRLVPGENIPYAFRALATVALAIARPDGRFTIDCPITEGGPFRLVASHPSYASGRSDPISPDEGIPEEVEIRLGRGATVQGRVTDGREPMGGVRVTLGPTGTQIPQEMRFLRNMLKLPRDGEVVHTGADGRFHFALLEEGAYVLAAEKPGLGNEWEEEISVADGDVAEREIELERGGVISGIVTDGAGRSVPEARVRAIPEANRGLLRVQKALGGSLATARTEEDGSFQLEGLPEGSFTLIAEKSGYAAAEASGVRMDETVRLVLTAACALAGRVIDAATGLPVQRFQVRLMTSEEGTPGDRLRAWRNVTDAEGTFRIDDLAAGGYNVVVQAPAFAAGTEEVAIGEGELLQIEIALAPAGRIAGTVVDDEDGHAIEAAFVMLAPPKDPGTGRPAERGFMDRPSAMTDGDGAFVVDRVPEGVHAILVRHGEYAPYRREEIAVAAGRETLVEVRLRRGFQAEGIVLDPDDMPVAGRVLMIEGPEGFRSRATTDGFGRFRFKGLKPGAYTIRCQAPDLPAPVEPVSFDVKGKDVRDLKIRLPESPAAGM